MRMRIFSLLILVAAAAVTLSAGADALKPFIGTWEGKHEGKTYTILKLKDADHVSGTISLGNIHTGEDGNITDVTEAADDASPILDPQFDGKNLTFGWKDGDDVTRIEMTLKGEGEAELRFLVEDGTPPVVRLRKAVNQRASAPDTISDRSRLLGDEAAIDFSSRSLEADISRTACSNASWFALEGLWNPVTLRTNCKAALSSSS